MLLDFGEIPFLFPTPTEQSVLKKKLFIKDVKGIFF